VYGNERNRSKREMRWWIDAKKRMNKRKMKREEKEKKHERRVLSLSLSDSI
jgi:hypothetical protein